MTATITVFDEAHVGRAVRLWEDTDYIGLSSADSPDALSGFLAKNPGLSFVALESDEVVGTILCGTDGRRGYIHHLAIAKAFRRQGLGVELLSRSLRALARIGIAKCHAFVFRDNPYGELFWGPSGWDLRGDLVVYSKPLPGGA